MSGNACTFVVSYFALFGVTIFYLSVFANNNWLTFDNGQIGLWSFCIKNETIDDDFHCSTLEVATSIGFLELTRVCACFALVFYVLFGLLGFVASDHQNTGEKSTAKKRTQEIGYTIGGIFLTIAVISYGLNYHDHYNEEYPGVTLGWVYYTACAICGVTFILVIILFCSRDVKTEFKPRTKVFVSKFKGVEKKQKTDPGANSRKNWLTNKHIPTPAAQKDQEAPQITIVSENIEVKKGLTQSIVAPTMVLLAIKKLKDGRSKKDSKAKAAVMDESNKMEKGEGVDKYKGIFTVRINNQDRAEVNPGPSPPLRTRADSSSSSYSSSSSGSSSSSLHSNLSDSDGSVVVTKTGAATDKLAILPTKLNSSKHTSDRKKPQLRQHFSQNEATLRENAARAVAGEDKRPSMERRTLSHKEMTSTAGVMAASTTGSEGAQPLNIYQIPPEPHLAGDEPIVYENVIDGSTDHGPAPDVTTTRQTRFDHFKR